MVRNANQNSSSHYSLQSNLSSRNGDSSNTPRRYRGFSTSISSLFLDETIVCPSIAWCGILSSSRTEHLLYVRDERRKVEGLKPPSRILSVSLGILMICIMMTYVIWGFGSASSSGNSNSSSGSYYNGYEGNIYNNNNNRKLDILSYKTEHFPHVMRFKDYHRQFWVPIIRMVQSTQYQADPTINIMTSSNTTNIGERDLKTDIFGNQELGSNIRFLLCLFFVILLGICGRRKRMMTRFAILKARAADDRMSYGGNVADVGIDGYRCGDICSHALCGLYPVDVSKEEDTEDRATQDCMNSAMSKFSSCCFGICCKMWFQCFSICAVAQEAREVRLLLPPFAQRIDYITHQPFEDYFQNIYMLRKSYKSSFGNHVGGWKTHWGALSILSRRILLFVIFTTLVLVCTIRFNHLAIFTWADFIILLLTFGQSFLVLGIVHGLFHKSDLSTDAVIKFFAIGFVVATSMAFLIEGLIINLLILLYYIMAYALILISGGNVLDNWIDNHYNLVLSIADIIQAFVVAALSEEICKYYTFRAVEHPDLLFLTGLDRHNHGSQAKIGGHEAYPYSSNNQSLVASVGSFDSTFSQSSVNHKIQRGHRGDRLVISTKRSSKKSSEEIEAQIDIRTLRQKAAAVTTAMISTAVGLACCENFMYIFFLTGHNARDQFTLLLIRSIFPVHALCAAIQSVGVITKFLEQDVDTQTIGIGRIIFPAVLLHGSFDAVLMLINTFVDVVEENGDERSSVIVNLVAAACVSSVMIIGLIFYYRTNRLQKARLKRYETITVFGQNEPEKEYELL